MDKVSARALMGASFGSLAVGETKPQRIGPSRFSSAIVSRGFVRVMRPHIDRWRLYHSGRADTKRESVRRALVLGGLISALGGHGL